MEDNPSSKDKNNVPSHTSHNDPYCEFKDDGERFNALLSRDLRIFGCRMVTVGGLVILALHTPLGSTLGLVGKILGRFKITLL